MDKTRIRHQARRICINFVRDAMSYEPIAARLRPECLAERSRLIATCRQMMADDASRLWPASLRSRIASLAGGRHDRAGAQQYADWNRPEPGLARAFAAVLRTSAAAQPRPKFGAARMTRVARHCERATVVSRTTAAYVERLQRRLPSVNDWSCLRPASPSARI